MAKSGSFNTSGYKFQSGTRYLTFSWELLSQSVEDNTSKIAWRLTGGGDYPYNPVCSDFHVEIDGDVVYDKPYSYHVNVFPDQAVASGEKIIKHGADGKKSFKVYVEAGIYVHEANCNGSDTFSLTTIPRASTITSAGNITLGNKCSVKWTPMASSFYYKLVFKLNAGY